MFRHFAKRALKLAEFKDHRALRSGLSNSGAFRRYATAAAAEAAEDTGDRRIPAEKFGDLRRRQVKAETEAWEKAVDEYMELTEIMCQKKLAPNLPYFKSLLLGWFEPLRDAIVGDQKGWDKKKVSKCTYEHISTLPPDMAAVVTMHKLMSLLMTSSDAVGSVRVVQAASQIGEAVEQEVSWRFIFSDAVFRLFFLFILFFIFKVKDRLDCVVKNDWEVPRH